MRCRKGGCSLTSLASAVAACAAYAAREVEAALHLDVRRQMHALAAAAAAAAAACPLATGPSRCPSCLHRWQRRSRALARLYLLVSLAIMRYVESSGVGCKTRASPPHTWAAG